MFSGVGKDALTHDNSTNSIELRHNQEQKMNLKENDFFPIDVAGRSVSAEIKLVTEPILKQFEKVLASLADRNDLGTA